MKKPPNKFGGFLFLFYLCITIIKTNKAMANYMDGMEGGKHNSDNTETSITAPSFTVSLTFESVNAKTPQEAVNKIVSWIKGEDGFGGVDEMIFDVQNEITQEKFTVDLSEDEEDQVLPNNL